MRAFVGLPLPDFAIQTLSHVQSELAVGRHVTSENLHLTLAFLDDQPEHALAYLDAELCNITGPVPEVKVTGLDVFGGSKARLLFAAVSPNEALTTLRKQVRNAARAAAIELPRERFRPHITLARFRHTKAPGEVEKLQEFLTEKGGFSLPGFHVQEFGLYRSTLTPEGAIYDMLASYPLN